jgi:hypothetical protein
MNFNTGFTEMEGLIAPRMISSHLMAGYQQSPAQSPMCFAVVGSWHGQDGI